MIKMELPLPPARDSPSGNATTPKEREALFLARNSARENHLVILILLAILIEITNMVFPQKCQLRLIFASS